MSSHKKVVLSLYRFNLINCKKLGYKIGTKYNLKTNNMILKKFYNKNVKLMQEDEIKFYIDDILNYKVFRQNPGKYIFYHIQKSFKDCKNIKSKVLINYHLDLGFSIARFLSQIN